MGCSNSKGRSEKQDELKGIGSKEADAAEVNPRIKLVLLGESGVGKSCLVLRYVKQQFDPASKVTIGAAFMSHSITRPDGSKVKFEIWDTAGQERYASLAPLYYRGASAAVVVYDITNTDSFQKAKFWVTELQKNASGTIVIILVGNKTDLADHRQVPFEEGQEYAARSSMLFIETSAKTAANVEAAFQAIAAAVMQPQQASNRLPLNASAPLPSGAKGDFHKNEG